MNSYLLTRLLYQELEKSEAIQVHCKPQHQALFFRIVQIQNQVGWETKSFDLPTDNTMFYSCIGSYKTYKKCFEDLLNWGLVRLVSPAKNQYQARRVSLYTDKWRTFFAGASSKQLPEQDQSTAEATTRADTHASSTHCHSTDQRSTEASPVNKTNKLLNEETSKPLNLKTFKNYGLGKAIKPTVDEVVQSSEIHFSAKETTINEYPPTQEKKKVAPKRNDNSAKPNESSSERREVSIKANPRPDLLFKDSPYADKLRFMQAFAGSEYAGANLDYYHEIVKNWSESKQAKKKDWIATVKNWMLRDFKEGKLVTHESSNNAQTAATGTAGKNGYTVLGDAVDAYFERKYGK